MTAIEEIALDNARRYLAWVHERFSGEWAAARGIVSKPREDGLFRRGRVRCLLPYVRAYWKEGDGELPPWEPAGCLPRPDGAYERFMGAPEVLDCVAALTDAPVDDAEAARARRVAWAIRRALRQWLVPVDAQLAEFPEVIDRRVEAMRLRSVRRKVGDEERVDYRWSRSPMVFPDSFRDAVAGLDPVHTPESSRAGLTRYLCDGWSIEGGRLKASADAERWGPSTSQVRPDPLFDAPRRLMLGAALRTRAVPLAGGARTATLRVGFAMHDGLTHEDAFVVSDSAAKKLRRRDPYRVAFEIPTLASRWKTVEEGAHVERGQTLAWAWIDLYALGARDAEVKALGRALGAAVDAGWLEVALPSAIAPVAGQVIGVARDGDADHRSRCEITVSIAAAKLQVGDKLATPHGVKGVVSEIRADEAMPVHDGVRAELLASQYGVVKRGAMGTFREMAPDGGAEPPRAGDIEVVRQPQDAVLSCRACGATPNWDARERGQRYGEMEFWALMAHGADKVAGELLSRERATAAWMKREEAIEPGDARELATRALNRFLALTGAAIEGGRFVRANVCGFPVRVTNGETMRAALDLIEDEARFRGQGAQGILLLDGVERFGLAVAQGKLVVVEASEGVDPISALPLLPPWLRPATPEGPHPLTRAYERLIKRLGNRSGDTQLLPAVPEAVRACYALALGERCGAGAFLRRQVLGRRVTRSARAVIVPDPRLRVDEIAIPTWVADRIFEGLDERPPLVLVNRNPTLHRYGLVAMRPVVEKTNPPHVFGLPLGILSAMNADFDGDQASVVALTSREALEQAQQLLPGASEMRGDPFRHNALAFPLASELSVSASKHGARSQSEWCDEHMRLLQRRLRELGQADDGWSDPAYEAAYEQPGKKSWPSRALWEGTVSATQWDDAAEPEMRFVVRSFRKKKRHGGVLRQQVYRRVYVPGEDAAFATSVAGAHAITSQWTQKALDVKSGDVETKDAFAPGKYFKDPVAAGRMLASLDETLDAEALARALGSSVEPTGLLGWMARPTAKSLVDAVAAAETSEPVPATDPRVWWFLK